MPTGFFRANLCSALIETIVAQLHTLHILTVAGRNIALSSFLQTCSKMFKSYPLIKMGVFPRKVCISPWYVVNYGKFYINTPH